MLFEKKFKIVEVRDNGVTITHFCRGSKKELKKDIEAYKQSYRHCQMIGKEGMVVWS